MGGCLLYNSRHNQPFRSVRPSRNSGTGDIVEKKMKCGECFIWKQHIGALTEGLTNISRYGKKNKFDGEGTIVTQKHDIHKFIILKDSDCPEGRCIL